MTPPPPKCSLYVHASRYLLPTSNPHATNPPIDLDDQEFFQQVLRKLVQIGADLAENIHQKALQNPEGPDQTPAFDRVARAVRRTIILARKLAEPPAVESRQPQIAARKQILRVVENRIGDKHEGPRAEALEAELRERLDSPDLEDDIDARPVMDIINDILRDLGLANMPGAKPWRRRTPADVQALAARAAAPPRRIPPKPPHLVLTPRGPASPPCPTTS